MLGVEAGQDAESVREIALALLSIRDELRATRNTCAAAICPGVSQVRRLQHTFLKSSLKHPDFIEMGLDLWEEVYDWQLETRQAVAIGRQPEQAEKNPSGPQTDVRSTTARGARCGRPPSRLARPS